MRTTKVNKDQLRETLLRNRDKHVDDYKAARHTWDGKVQQRLKDVWHESVSGNFENVQSPISDLPKPEHFTESYDSALEQLKWEVSDIVELDESEFQQYVLNNWSWRHRFMANTSSYLAS